MSLYGPDLHGRVFINADLDRKIYIQFNGDHTLFVKCLASNGVRILIVFEDDIIIIEDDVIEVNRLGHPLSSKFKINPS